MRKEGGGRGGRREEIDMEVQKKYKLTRWM
jgi:hypothetical protein